MGPNGGCEGAFLSLFNAKRCSATQPRMHDSGWVSERHFPLPLVTFYHPSCVELMVLNVSGREPCRCDRVGSLNDSCDIQSGQCSCKLGVTGRQCDQCERYHWGFSYEGCSGCNCNPEGALDLQCEVRTGQCRCKANIEGQRCDRCVENKYNITLGCLGESIHSDLHQTCEAEKLSTSFVRLTCLLLGEGPKISTSNCGKLTSCTQTRDMIFFIRVSQFFRSSKITNHSHLNFSDLHLCSCLEGWIGHATGQSRRYSPCISDPHFQIARHVTTWCWTGCGSTGRNSPSCARSSRTSARTPAPSTTPTSGAGCPRSTSPSTCCSTTPDLPSVSRQRRTAQELVPVVESYLLFYSPDGYVCR